MWRTHKNRMDKNLGGTYSSSGYHESMMQDFNMVIPNASLTPEMLWDGALMDQHFDNPFLRWHKSFEDYPSFILGFDLLTWHQTVISRKLDQSDPLVLLQVPQHPWSQDIINYLRFKLDCGLYSVLLDNLSDIGK